MGKMLDYVQEWKLLDPQPLWNEQPAVLKLLTPAGIHDEKNNALALRCFNVKAAVRLLLCDDQAQLLEYTHQTQPDWV